MKNLKTLRADLAHAVKQPKVIIATSIVVIASAVSYHTGVKDGVKLTLTSLDS